MSDPAGFSWIEKPLLAAMGRPRSEEDLQWLRLQGIEVLLSLTEEAPRRDWTERSGLLVFHVPIEDMEPPTQDDFDRCVSAITKAQAKSMGVAVHCGAGFGRTGTILAAYLVSRGVPVAEAVSRVRRLRPGSIETEGQSAAVIEYARRLKQPAPVALPDQPG